MKGEAYCIQPIQLDRLLVFLKKPENNTKGRTTAGVAELTDLASLTMLPMKSPNDIPQKFIRKIINQNVKNC